MLIISCGGEALRRGGDLLPLLSCNCLSCLSGELVLAVKSTEPDPVEPTLPNEPTLALLACVGCVVCECAGASLLCVPLIGIDMGSTIALDRDLLRSRGGNGGGVRVLLRWC